MGLGLPVTLPPEAALQKALAGLDAGSHVAVATVIERRGSAPSSPGQKLVMVRSSPHEIEAFGTVGGGAIERSVMTTMRDSLERQAEPTIHQFQLGPSLGMCCGGSVTVLVETLQPAWTVLIVGAGHVGLATAKLTPRLGFRTVLLDDREEAHQSGRLEDPAIECLFTNHDDPQVLAQVAPQRAFAVVMTHDHQLDQDVVEWAIRVGFAFVGGVGSRAKAARLRTRLLAKQFSASDVERVRMPVGVEIGARRPEEIAVAIAAELVQERSLCEKLVRKRSP